jgi:hypothetical protein
LDKVGTESIFLHGSLAFLTASSHCDDEAAGRFLAIDDPAWRGQQAEADLVITHPALLPAGRIFQNQILRSVAILQGVSSWVPGSQGAVRACASRHSVALFEDLRVGLAIHISQMGN